MSVLKASDRILSQFLVGISENWNDGIGDERSMFDVSNLDQLDEREWNT